MVLSPINRFRLISEDERNDCRGLHICRTTVCWDPEILLPWQRDVMTSPPYFFSFFVLFCFVYFENKISHFVIASSRPWQIGFQIKLENFMKCSGTLIMLPDYSSSQSIDILRLAVSSEALLQCKHHRIPCISKHKFLYYVRHRGFVPIN